MISQKQVKSPEWHPNRALEEPQPINAATIGCFEGFHQWIRSFNNEPNHSSPLSLDLEAARVSELKMTTDNLSDLQVHQPLFQIGQYL